MAMPTIMHGLPLGPALHFASTGLKSNLVLTGKVKHELIFCFACRRVHDLTEGIRNDFLPSAFNVILPQCEDPKAEFTPERCRVSLCSLS